MPEGMKTNPLTGKLTFDSLKPIDLSNCTKKQIKEYFENSYDLNESLFTSLKDDTVFYRYPDALRLPLIFYYAHTACVYTNKLVLAGLVKPEDRFSFEFETLFETGVDEMSWDDTENYRMGGKFEWPPMKEVVEYRRNVRQMILKIIDDTPLSLPITRDSPWWALMMGIEHERIHLETSSVLIRQLPVSMVTKPNKWKYAPAKYGAGIGKNALIRVAASEVTIGKPYDFPSYGWDNEYGEWTTKVPPFEASKYLITNGEFYEFVKEGGYKKRSLWSDEGWQWLQFRQASHPTFWVCDKECKSGCGGDLASYSHCKPVEHLTNGQNSYCNGHSVVDENGHQGKDEGGGIQQSQYKFRCMFDVVDMPWDWPVEVNYHEAKAFCAWKGPEYRLPAEAEHHTMRGPQSPASDGTSCDIIFRDDTNANNNLRYGSSTPVNMFSSTGAGFHDVFGNVWEWTEDHFNGLPGYSSDPLYDDFSSPCFDGRHTLMMGGAWVSTGDEASRFARFAFRRHFFQHLGFRLARSVDSDEKVDLPVRLVNDKVFVLGVGVADNPVQLKEDKHNISSVSSTNHQFKEETEEALNRQLWDEYSDQSDVYVISQLVKQSLEKYAPAAGGGRGLHIGSATGALTFSIAPNFSEVLGTDYSGRYIDVCLRLQKGETVNYTDPTPGGDATTIHEAVVPSSAETSNITFKQLTWLPNEVEHFDTVLLTSIGRLLNPKAWLMRFKEVAKKGGVVMITTAGQWDVNALMSAIGNKFNLVESCKIEAAADYSSVFTIWKHE